MLDYTYAGQGRGGGVRGGELGGAGGGLRGGELGGAGGGVKGGKFCFESCFESLKVATWEHTWEHTTNTQLTNAHGNAQLTRNPKRHMN